MFIPLKGKAHVKAYLRNKEYATQYKQYKEYTINQWIDTLQQYKTCLIQSDNFTFIMTPSFYDKVIQFTTFSHDMKPLSHHTYNDITELVEDNSFFYNNKNKIVEYTI